ncbi:Alpha/Beta hydrolase protein, partial [Gaertneriomyces semiglobifer]
ITEMINGKRLNVLFIPHKLGRSLPLIVFIHGMGASLDQFTLQIAHFSKIANILALDLVGHGQSERVQEDSAYTTPSIVNDIVTLLDIYKESADSVILICHSYGCAIGTHLFARMQERIKALVFLCPKAMPTPHDLAQMNKFISTPTLIVDLFRYFDRRGGIHSTSVSRLLSEGASDEIRLKQLNWNKANTTVIAKKTFKGMQWPTPEEYAKLTCPVLLVGGEEDLVCPPRENLHVIQALLPDNIISGIQSPSGQGDDTATKKNEIFIIPNAAHMVMVEQPEVLNAIIYHWLLESGFHAMNLSHLLHLKNPPASKWNLKNSAKWHRTPTVSPALHIFRPMKTMLQTSEHNPTSLTINHPEIGLVIDISSDPPPYEPTDLSKSGGCTYLKLPTKSKLPPSPQVVAEFISIVREFNSKNPDRHIAIHCHYGFNRTGFLVCCYLIQECQWSVKRALEGFEKVRPPGIRHIHFKDELYMRY